MDTSGTAREFVFPMAAQSRGSPQTVKILNDTMFVEFVPHEMNRREDCGIIGVPELTARDYNTVHTKGASPAV